MEKRTDRLTYKSNHGGYGYSHDLDMYDPEIKDYIGRLEDSVYNDDRVPRKRVGNWVKASNKEYKCSYCGCDGMRDWMYCHRCGAVMKGRGD